MALEKKIFIICPVREADQNEKDFLAEYVSMLEMEGNRVHLPARDTRQDDATGGYNICSQNYDAICESDEVHVYWTEKSKGSLFDIGASFGENKKRGKPIKLINREYVEKAVERQKKEGIKKSFEMVLLRLDDECRNS
jgi:hypothetical protein